MMHSISRILKYAIQNFFRNFWLSLATLLVMVVLILLVNVIISIGQIKSSILSSVNQRIDLALFFKPNLPEAEILKVKEELERSDAVGSVTVVTPEQGLEELKQSLPEIGERILPALESNPLGYKLEVTARSIDQFLAVLDRIEKNPSYKDKLERHSFVDSRQIASYAASLSEKVNIAAIAFALVLGLIAVIIIFNAIRVSIYTHRDEISIMKLVGATNQFIRLPFLVESVLYTLVALGAVAGILFFTLPAVQPSIDTFFEGLAVINLFDFYKTNAARLFGVQLLTLLALNVVSTGLALRRYLKN